MKVLLKNQIIYEITLIVCIFSNIIHTHQVIMHLPKMHYVIYPTSHVFFLLLEGLSIYYIAFIVPKKREALLLFLYFIYSIILWINVAYSRYFDTYMPLTLYGEFNNLNGLLPNIIDAFEWNDLFFVITGSLVITTYFICKDEKKTKLEKILPIAIGVVLFISFTHYFYSIKKDHDHLAEHFKDLNDQRSIWETMMDRRRMMENTASKTSAFYHGIGLTLFINCIEKMFRTEKIKFSEKEHNIIKKYMYASHYNTPQDTTKNLILIIVESLSSYPINKSFGGIELTPNINKLITKSYYNPNMSSETLLGESSDGQFIYLTGLLPLKNGVTINEIRAQQITTFISIAKKQYPNLHSQMTIPTEKDSWSQEAMCKKYGIDSLFSKEGYPSKIREEWLNDKQLFEYASMKDKSLKPPFVSLILTSSTHSPYIKSYENYHIQYPANYSTELKHYLNNIHYMDKYIGQYLRSLKQYSWFDQCTIIITADHKPNGNKLNCHNANLFTKIPLIIIHPSQNIGNEICSINQSSVFPTILDLYHIDTNWKGVGQSIFMPKHIIESAYEVKRIEHKQIISNYLLNNYYLE